MVDMNKECRKVIDEQDLSEYNQPDNQFWIVSEGILKCAICGLEVKSYNEARKHMLECPIRNINKLK